MEFVDFCSSLFRWAEQTANTMRSIQYWGVSLWDVFVASLIVGIILAIVYGGKKDA